MAAWDSDPIIKEAAPAAKANANAWDEAPIVEAAAVSAPQADNTSPPEKQDIGALRAGLRGFNDALTFGFADEINSALGATLNPLTGSGNDGESWQERYDRNVAGERSLNRQAKTDSPISSGFGSAVGGIAPAILSAGSTLLPSAGRSLAGTAAQVAPAGIAEIAGKGAVAGAGYGGAYGLGAAEGDLSQRLPKGVEGALVGAVVGGGIPVVASGASSASRKVIGGESAPNALQVTQAAPAPAQGGATADALDGAAKSIVEAAGAPARKQLPTIERLAAEVAPDQSILDAAGRLGMTEKLIPSQYSGSQAYREIEQGLASIPGSQLNAQQKEAYAAISQQADDLITRYGGTTDKSGLSDKFKQQGLNTIEDLGKKSDSLYEQVSAAIPAATRTNPTSTTDYLAGKLSELGDRNLLSSAERRTLATLSRTDEAGQAIAPTYAALDLIRKEVGNGLRGAGRFKDTETGALRRLYSTLSDDQQRTAEAMGVGEAFSSAKALVAQRKQVEEGLSQVLGKDLSGALSVSLGNSVKQLGKGNFKDFDKVVEQIPAGMRKEAVLTALNDAFTAGSRAEKQMSAPGFVDWYSGLMRNDAARIRLQKHLPIGASQQLDDIFIVAKGMRDASKERITTGRINSLLENFASEGGMLSRLWDVGKKVGAAEGVTSGLGIPGAGTVGVLATTLSKQKTPIAESAGKLLSSQKFKDAVSAYSAAGGELKANVLAREKQLMRTQAYRKWLDSLSEQSRASVNALGPLAYLAGRSSEGG